MYTFLEFLSTLSFSVICLLRNLIQDPILCFIVLLPQIPLVCDRFPLFYDLSFVKKLFSIILSIVSLGFHSVFIWLYCGAFSRRMSEKFCYSFTKVSYQELLDGHMYFIGGVYIDYLVKVVSYGFHIYHYNFSSCHQ